MGWRFGVLDPQCVALFRPGDIHRPRAQRFHADRPDIDVAEHRHYEQHRNDADVVVSYKRVVHWSIGVPLTTRKKTSCGRCTKAQRGATTFALRLRNKLAQCDSRELRENYEQSGVRSQERAHIVVVRWTMGIKDLLVHIDNTLACEFRVALAVEVARRFGADLTGLYVKPSPIPAGYLGSDIGIFVDDGAFDTNNVQIQRRIEAAATSAETAFRRILHQQRIEGDWKVATGSMAQEVSQWAQHMDLAVIGRSDPGAVGTDISAVGEILLAIGRPTIILPHSYVGRQFGEHILVAWQPQREAVRAVNDSLAFLRSAKSVTVVAVESHSNQHEAISLSLEALERHLMRHGVTARMRSIPAGSKSIGECILEQVQSSGVDLIISGAYGHSRLREVIFGGVTRSLLDGSDIPLLMSH